MKENYPSNSLEIICSVQEYPQREGETIVLLTADRATLAKRRWRGVAQDGQEFGFDLDHVLVDGSVFHREGGKCYVISQATEPVLEIELGGDSAQAAVLGWQIGNLHFPIEVTEFVIRSADDPAIRHMLQREAIPWRPATAVFRPFKSAGYVHHH
jgi:urease accessory protein